MYKVTIAIENEKEKTIGNILIRILKLLITKLVKNGNAEF